MITKTDCLTILVSMENLGLDINTQMKKLIMSKDVPEDVLRFIVENRGIEVVNFYEMLRKKHNKNKSPLYYNIVKEQEDPENVVTTLACLLVQIVLYCNKLPSNKEVFQRAVRAEEITRVLNIFYSTGELEQCLALLKLIRADLLVLEHMQGRR